MFKRIVLASLLAAASLGVQAAEKYTIDPTHTQVRFTYNHLGFSNITGRFDEVQSEFLFDPRDPARSSVSITIPVAGISTGVEKLDAHLLSEEFFDAGKFPTATFKSTAVAAVSPTELEVTGDLTIHGVTRQVQLDVTINKIGEHPMAKAPAAGFDATTRIKRSEFDIGGYVPMVSDDVEISITVEAVKAK